MPTSPRPGPGRSGRGRRYLAAFARFWWDFLVGETPELFVGMLVVLGLALLLAGTGAGGWTAVPLAVIAVLALSVARGRSGA